jgi:hypothetical protein
MRNTQNEAPIMRILAAALGALLISTSQPALALGGHEQQTEAQQTEPQQAEAPAAETQPANTPQPDMRQAETQPAETQHGEMQQAEVTQDVAPPGEPQPQMQQAAPPQIEPLQGAFAAVPQAGLPSDVKWTVFVELKYGTRLDVPSAVFATPDGPASRGVGRQFKTPDGRASLAVYSQRNDARDTPASHLRKNLKSPRAALDYERVTPGFFAISAVMRGSIYYSRCNFSHNADRAIHCFDLKYPVQEKQSWDGIVTRMSRSLQPLHGG